ncbi:COP9 signalosome complex subunit 8 isoform X1 [Malania oleifera]|uniref:COP9 signalosome complex subunit 8 isoform X1 n=1 Tax=Malania oleifera TaxID=397392 RepID=UPI0025AE0846|nr:COP9 signalosome complex subunit 8 isoform X1 [Malania oleifera]
MDFSLLQDALASKSYTNIADICDELMLQVAAEGIAFQDEWPYAIHLLGHIYVDDVARFLWKSIPSAVKEGRAEVVAAWKIGQRLWTRDYAGVHEAIRGFDWSQEPQGLVASFSELYTERMFQLLMSAYSTISVQDAALFLGMEEDDATNCKNSAFAHTPVVAHNAASFSSFGACRCGAARMDCGAIFQNADHKEAAYCDGAEIGSQQIAAPNRVRLPLGALKMSEDFPKN